MTGDFIMFGLYRNEENEDDQDATGGAFANTLGIFKSSFK